MNPSRIFPRQDGMSLIEIMVGLVIGMVTVLAILQTISVSEGQRRTTGGGADALTAGATAMYLVERQLRMAGYGLDMNDDGLLELCRANGLKYYYQPPSSGSGPAPAAIEATITAADFAPVIINTAPGNTLSDAGSYLLQISYSSTSEVGVNGVDFTQPSGASAVYKVSDRSGFRLGDLVVATEAGQACTIAEVTGLPASNQCNEGGSASQTDNVIHSNGNYKNSYQNCQTLSSAWNKPGGLGVDYTTGRLYNLGNQGLAHISFAVLDQRLMTCTRLGPIATNCATAANWTPLVEGIVALRARYGLDTDGDGDIDTWSAQLCNPAAACTREEVLAALAVRLSMVAINGQFERDAVTAAAPQWLTEDSLDVDAESFDLTHLPDWQNFRYRVLETTIPLRNLIWAQ